jgi:hypothetical protein
MSVYDLTKVQERTVIIVTGEVMERLETLTKN